jgi:hypothetical protein
MTSSKPPLPIQKKIGEGGQEFIAQYDSQRVILREAQDEQQEIVSLESIHPEPVEG